MIEVNENDTDSEGSGDENHDQDVQSRLDGEDTNNDDSPEDRTTWYHGVDTWIVLLNTNMVIDLLYCRWS